MDSIRQRKLGRGRREFEIKGPLVVCRIKNNMLRQDYRVELVDLNPLSDRISGRAGVALGCSVISGIGLIFFIGMALFSQVPDQRSGGFGLAIGAVAALGICLVKYYTESYEFVRFSDRYTGQPVILMFADKPSRQAVDEFVDTLEARIKATVLGRPKEHSDGPIGFSTDR